MEATTETQEVPIEPETKPEPEKVLDPLHDTKTRLESELAEVQRIKAQLIEERQRLLEADMGFIENPDVKSLLDEVAEAADKPKKVDPLDQQSVQDYLDRKVKEQVALVVKSIQEKQEAEQAKLQYQALQAKYPQLKETAFKRQLNALLDNYESRGLSLDFEDAIVLTNSRKTETERTERAEIAAQSGTGNTDRTLPFPQLDNIDDVKEVLRKRGLIE
jgi:hypothetical protein